VAAATNEVALESRANRRAFCRGTRGKRKRVAVVEAPSRFARGISKNSCVTLNPTESAAPGPPSRSGSRLRNHQTSSRCSSRWQALLAGNLILTVTVQMTLRLRTRAAFSGSAYAKCRDEIRVMTHPWHNFSETLGTIARPHGHLTGPNTRTANAVVSVFSHPSGHYP
jgi:hypothetical protein